MVVVIRDWCQNVGEYNTYNFCIWHFGLCVIVSKIDRCRSSDPPYEIAINPIFRSYRVSDVIIQSFLNRSRWNLVHTLVARRARSAISDCLVWVMFSLDCSDLIICAIFTIHWYSSIETTSLCKILEQSVNYSWIYCILINWGILRFFNVPSEALPLYQILKQLDNWLWRYCIWNIWGIQKVSSRMQFGVDLVIDIVYVAFQILHF